MEPTDKDWRRVGRAIDDRMKKLVIGPSDVLARGGPSDKPLKGYLAGGKITKKPTKRGLCDALGWSHDSIDLILANKRPRIVSNVAPKTIPERLTRLEEAVARQGEILEEIVRGALGDGHPA